MTWNPADDPFGAHMVEDLRRIIGAASEIVPSTATGLDSGAVVFDAAAFADDSPARRDEVLADVAWALSKGPGIVVIPGAVPLSALDPVSEVFFSIIDEERASGVAAGDHFAAAGANDRIWNSAEKLAIRAPELFVEYHRHPVIDAVSRAWLGPGYQLTAQVNVVNPGGTAQQPHRDYHLGFLGCDAASAFPPHVHQMSPMLTLQGAVAHCDMPRDAGPTTYLPHSQKYPQGYLAWSRPAVQEFFADQHQQPVLAAGDAVFFNPALFHAAGHNQTGHVRRIANLLQVSSPFGRAMERLDRGAMCAAVAPHVDPAVMSEPEVRRVVAACAEAYPFPADLDVDQPVDGMLPETMSSRWLAELGLGRDLGGAA